MKTNEQFLRELSEKNPGITVNEKYHGCYNKIEFQCELGHTWKAQPYSVLNGSGCPVCAHKRKMGISSFLERLNQERRDLEMVGPFDGMTTSTLFHCNSGEDHYFEATPRSVLPTKRDEGKMCPFCKEQERKNYAIQKLAKMNPNITVVGEYINADTPVDVQCEYGHIFKSTFSNLYKGNGCPICFQEHGKYLNNHNRCLWDDRQDIARLLKNPDDGYKYSHGSGIDVDFICPDCGAIVHKKINDVSLNGLRCPECHRQTSYPNKFMHNLLKQLQVAFIPEYHPEWANGRFYDFYFKIGDFEYIIEMDGFFHYHSFYNNVKEVQAIDHMKDVMAEEHGITMIRINCDYGWDRYDYIVNSISASKLSLILNLDLVDYQQCHNFASMSNLRIVADHWINGIRSLKQLSELTNWDRGTISHLIRQAADVGLIKETHEQLAEIIKREGYKNRVQTNNSIRVRCIETGEIFPSLTAAVQKYHDYKIYKNSLPENVGKYAGKTHDGQMLQLTWERLI